jgi:hypothetical protein
MRRLLAWLACAAGAAWIVRRLRRRPPEPAVDPAEELRRKLDESRTSEQSAAEPAGPDAAGLDERRRAVHDRGRAAIDEMRSRSSRSDG